MIKSFYDLDNKTREGFLRKNIVAVLRSKTFSLKVNKLPIFSEITQTQQHKKLLKYC